MNKNSFLPSLTHTVGIGVSYLTNYLIHFKLYSGTGNIGLEMELETEQEPN